jgi:hypothetical protein
VSRIENEKLSHLKHGTFNENSLQVDPCVYSEIPKKRKEKNRGRSKEGNLLLIQKGSRSKK